jgi:hypothetical protein
MFFLMMMLRMGRNAGRSSGRAPAKPAPQLSAQEQRWIAECNRIIAGLPAKAEPFVWRQKLGAAIGGALAFAVLGGVLAGVLLFALHLAHVRL